jgi:hypothetical protein
MADGGSNPLTARLKFGASTSQKASLRARQAALAPKPAQASNAHGRRFVPNVEQQAQATSSTGMPLKGSAAKLKAMPGGRPASEHALPSPARDSGSSSDDERVAAAAAVGGRKGPGGGGGGAAGKKNAGRNAGRAKIEVEAPESFVESLKLTPSQIAEFKSGSFLYLRESTKTVGEQGTLNAYNLEVIPHILIDPKHYYTISQQGITHFRGDNVAFTDLESWERNFQTFWSIRHIRFFQVYKKWKAFYQWSKWLSNLRIRRAGSHLQANLFLFNMRLQKPLLHLHANCQVAREQELIEVRKGKTYTLAEFQEVQNNRRHAVSDWLESFLKQVVLLVRGACDDVLDKFLSHNRIDGDHKLTFMERASLRKECQKLVRFVRMTDFVLQDTLRFVAVQSAAAFNSHVSPEATAPLKVFINAVEFEEARGGDSSSSVAAATTSGRSGHGSAGAGVGVGGVDGAGSGAALTPLFKVEVSFDGSGAVELLPPSKEFVAAIDRIVLDAVAVVATPARLMEHQELTPYTAVATERADDVALEKADLPQQVLKDKSFAASRAAVQDGVERAIAAAYEYCAVFQPYNKIFKDNAQIQGNIMERYKDVDVTVFRELIDKFRGQGQSFSGIPCVALARRGRLALRVGLPRIVAVCSVRCCCSP